MKKSHAEKSTLTLSIQAHLSVVPLTDGSYAKVPEPVVAELRDIIMSDLRLIIKRMDTVLIDRFEKATEPWEVITRPTPTFYINESN